MEQKSLTALISAFSRAYHALNNEVTIFNDSLARDLLTDEEFNQIRKLQVQVGHLHGRT